MRNIFAVSESGTVSLRAIDLGGNKIKYSVLYKENEIEFEEDSWSAVLIEYQEESISVSVGGNFCNAKFDELNFIEIDEVIIKSFVDEYRQVLIAEMGVYVFDLRGVATSTLKLSRVAIGALKEAGCLKIQYDDGSDEVIELDSIG